MLSVLFVKKPTELLTSSLSAVYAPVHGKLCLSGSFSLSALCYTIFGRSYSYLLLSFTVRSNAVYVLCSYTSLKGRKHLQVPF